MIRTELNYSNPEEDVQEPEIDPENDKLGKK